MTHHDTLYDMLGKDHWGDTEVTARSICAFRHVITVQSLRPTNDRKADQITVALSFQVAAIAALSVAIGRELFASSEHHARPAACPESAGRAVAWS